MKLEQLNKLVNFSYNSSKNIKCLHWNYKDKDFWVIHPKLDKVYDFLLDSADTLAEMGRQDDFIIDPFGEVNEIEAKLYDHENSLKVVDVILTEFLNEIIELREGVECTGHQSEIDQLIYDCRVLQWKFNSGK